VTLFWLASVAVLAAGAALCLGLGPRRRGDTCTGALALAIVIAVTLGKVLLLTGQFRPVPVTVAALTAAASAAAWLIADRAARRRAAATLRLFAARPGLTFAPVAWVTCAAVVAATGYFGYLAGRLPPIAWDALYYHLISVAEWVRTGHLVSPVQGMSSPATDVQAMTQADTFPKDTELVAAWFAVFTRGVSLVQLAQVVFLPLLFSGTYGICRHLGIRSRWAVLAGGIAVLSPAVLSQVSTNYADVARAATVVASWQFLLAAFPARPDALDLRDGPAGPRLRSLLLAGTCLGLAAGIKPSNLMFCAAAPLVGVGLCALRTRRATAARGQPGWDVPSPARCFAAVCVPMVTLGSFWYLRTWLRWGSPTWPLTVGPFPGRADPEAWVDVGGLAIPAPWRGSSPMVLLARDLAASLPAFRPATLDAGDTAGLAWLLAALPAIALCLAIPAVRRRHLRGLLAVVLPLLLITILAPGAWHARYSLALLPAGGIALAMVIDSDLLERSRPVLRAAPALAGSAALALAIWQAWDLAQDPSWNVPPGVRGVHAVLALAARPAQVRRDTGPWAAYNAMQREMTAPGAVGFFSTAPPLFTLPYAGQDFSHAVANIGPFPWSGTGPAPGSARIEQLITAAHVRYVYVLPGSPTYTDLHAHPVARLRPLPAVSDGSMFELTPGQAAKAQGPPVAEQRCPCPHTHSG